MHTSSPYFSGFGLHVLVDGQFGSTGKGALAAYLAEQPNQPIWHYVVTSAGPNSGHTFYHKGEKHVLKQLPTFAVKHCLQGNPIPVYFCAGAIIDPEILSAEMDRYPSIPVFIHPMAAVITPEDKRQEHSGTIAAVAGTRSGTGAAMARKVLRDPYATFGHFFGAGLMGRVGRAYVKEVDIAPDRYASFMEVSQGFSLGINSQFYPKVTSRECTVMQALADARVNPFWLRRTYMSIRTFPIRVGNVDGYSSGDCYPDQRELDWGRDFPHIDPERTTVTNRVRRIFTFSETQFKEAMNANMPEVVFVNFMNYLEASHVRDFQERVCRLAVDCGCKPRFLWGWGPQTGDVVDTVYCDPRSS